MRRLALASLLCTVVWAGDAASELEALQEEFDSSKLGFKERSKAFQPRYEKLAQEYAGTEEGLAAQLWLLRNCWWVRFEDQKNGVRKMNALADPMADRILAAYPEAKGLADLPKYGYVLSAAKKDEVYRAMLEKSPHREVRAAALFGLAVMRKDRAMFERLGKEYGELAYRATTYGAMADAHLNVHPAEALAEGAVAPGIEGTDGNGRPLKLSDFRGKVVLLDFWGDW